LWFFFNQQADHNMGDLEELSQVKMVTGWGFPAPHKKKSSPPMGIGTGMGIEINPRMGKGMGTGLKLQPVPVPTSPLREISPSPSPLSCPRLGKNSHPCFFLLDFSSIMLSNLCIVKVVLHEFIKL